MTAAALRSSRGHHATDRRGDRSRHRLPVRRHGRRAGDAVKQVMTTDPRSCHPEDDVAAVEQIMMQAQVRRVPVVDGQGDCRGHDRSGDLAGETGGQRGELGRGSSGSRSPASTEPGRRADHTFVPRFPACSALKRIVAWTGELPSPPIGSRSRPEGWCRAESQTAGSASRRSGRHLRSCFRSETKGGGVGARTPVRT